ncbi:hypothetical protein ALC60_07230 [Trachymyrmex zeteki]|uniref:Uncharacterized protein n=1 Tax=Mycetomoellerius zeteki TaxID=64791 RepID=A0A151X0I4_9HYME|nr:hypothetical protein ALC60_07230 [Trachymyrmex zeteki]
MDSKEKGAINKRKIREFQSSWLDENVFKGWLAPRNFMTVNSLKCISNLNVDNEQNILNLENIYVGLKCENLFNLLNYISFILL